MSPVCREPSRGAVTACPTQLFISAQAVGTHTTHGSHPADFMPSAATRGLIRNLTRNDYALWAASRRRFVRDVATLTADVCFPGE